MVNAAAWTDKAIVKPYEGPWLQLERKPLTRGATYSMYGGSGSSRSVTGDGTAQIMKTIIARHRAGRAAVPS